MGVEGDTILGSGGLYLALPVVCTAKAKDRVSAGKVGEGWQ